MIAKPPFEAGALNETVAWLLPGAALVMVGAPGTVAGVTVFDAVDGALVPTALVAVTVQLTGVPFVRPVTTIVVPAADPLRAPQVAV